MIFTLGVIYSTSLHITFHLSLACPSVPGDTTKTCIKSRDKCLLNIDRNVNVWKQGQLVRVEEVNSYQDYSKKILFCVQQILACKQTSFFTCRAFLFWHFQCISLLPWSWTEILQLLFYKYKNVISVAVALRTNWLWYFKIHFKCL